MDRDVFLRRLPSSHDRLLSQYQQVSCSMCFFRHPIGPGDIFYRTVAFCLLFSLIPVLIAQIFGVTSQSTFWKTWVIDYWIHHYGQALPGILRIFMHVGLALLPLSIPMAISIYRRPLFWGAVIALLILTVWSILFVGGIPDPLEGMWQLNTLGRERHLLQGPTNSSFLPFMVNLFSFHGFRSFFRCDHCESYRCNLRRYWKPTWPFCLVRGRPFCSYNGSLVLWSMEL